MTAESSRQSKTGLTNEALKLAMAANPDGVVRSLAKAVSSAIGSASIQSAVQRVDELGIDRMIVAAMGNDLATHRLGVDLDLARRLQEGRPMVTPQGFLRLASLLDLIRIKETAIPWIQSVGLLLDLREARNVTLSMLQEVGGDLDLEGAMDVVLPRLQKVGGYLNLLNARGALSAFHKVRMDMLLSRTTGMAVFAPQGVGGSMHLDRTMNVYLSALQVVGGNLDLRWAVDVSLPALQEVGGSLHLHAATNVTLPVLKKVGKRLDLKEARDISLPTLQKVGGRLDRTEATNVAFPMLQKVDGQTFVQDPHGSSIPTV